MCSWSLSLLFPLCIACFGNPYSIPPSVTWNWPLLVGAPRFDIRLRMTKKVKYSFSQFIQPHGAVQWNMRGLLYTSYSLPRRRTCACTPPFTSSFTCTPAEGWLSLGPEKEWKSDSKGATGGKELEARLEAKLNRGGGAMKYAKEILPCRVVKEERKKKDNSRGGAKNIAEKCRSADSNLVF